MGFCRMEQTTNLNLYIQEKVQVMKDFGVAKSVIDAIPWWNMKSEYDIDHRCRDIIYRHLCDCNGTVN